MILLVVDLVLAGGPLETEPVSARTEAVVLQQHAETLGFTARVVRRYRQGAGWEFVVQADVGDEVALDEAAQTLQQASGVAVVVLSEGTASASRAAPVEGPPVGEVLERAGRAHGGADGADRLASAETVRFRYHRVLDVDGEILRASSSWARSAADLRLVLDVQEGPGESSTLVVTEEGAWIATDDQAIERDPGLARELAGRHGPDELLAFAFALPGLLRDAAADAATWRAGAGGPELHVIEQLGGDGEVATRIWIDSTTWRVGALELRDDTGVSAVTLSDWREVSAGLVVPFELERRRDEVRIDLVEVLELGLDVPLEPSLFDPPDRHAGSP